MLSVQVTKRNKTCFMENTKIKVLDMESSFDMNSLNYLNLEGMLSFSTQIFTFWGLSTIRKNNLIPLLE